MLNRQRGLTLARPTAAPTCHRLGVYLTLHFLRQAGNQLVSLSVQQLLECDHQGTDNGCGGSVSNLDAYQYVIQNKGPSVRPTQNAPDI